MAQGIHFTEIPLMISGGGHIDENALIDLLEYVSQASPKRSNVQIIRSAPQKIRISKQIGKTVYDVATSFDTEGKQPLLQQFKNMILRSP
jgi:hypothetical protein